MQEKGIKQHSNNKLYNFSKILSRKSIKLISFEQISIIQIIDYRKNTTNLCLNCEVSILKCLVNLSECFLSSSGNNS